jgi:hypothetical protein
MLDRWGRVSYRKMFAESEEERSKAIQLRPSLQDIVTVVGSLENDRVLENTARRDEFRGSLGYAQQDIVVLILSSWGEHCLWHTMGDSLLEEARRLMRQYKFVLSAHPHEYRAQPPGQRVWGEYLRSQRQYGFIVREPAENWIPYMVASDIVVSDFTGLLQYAVLLEKPIVLTPVPKQAMWEDFVATRIRKIVPMLPNAQSLRERLADARERYPREKVREIAEFVHPHPGEAAGRIRKEIYRLLKMSSGERVGSC